MDHETPMTRQVLAPYLPSEPMTPEQRKLFDEHLELVDKVFKFERRKYSDQFWSTIKSACYIGLMGAAERYRSDSGVLFSTFALRTMKWIIYLQVRRELGIKDNESRKSRQQRERIAKHAYYGPEAHRAVGALPDVVMVEDSQENHYYELVDKRTPESEYIRHEGREAANRIVRRAKEAASARDFRVLELRMQDLTLEAVGKEFGFCRERARQLENRARRAVKQAMADAPPEELHRALGQDP